jgi:oligoribonuclease (3'-5' exoribonuclease)
MQLLGVGGAEAEEGQDQGRFGSMIYGWVSTSSVVDGDEKEMLEVALIVTDGSFVPLGGGSLALTIKPSARLTQKMRERSLEQTTMRSLARTRLLDDCLRGFPLHEVERAMLGVVEGKGSIRPSGESVSREMDAIRPVLPSLSRRFDGPTFDLIDFRTTAVDSWGYPEDSYHTWVNPSQVRAMDRLKEFLREVRHIHGWLRANPDYEALPSEDPV